MEAYTGFAAVYDIFMDNVPYEEWSSYLHGLLLEHGIEEGIVLDLGCGTGAMTERLAAFGYDMIGVDNSEDMLELAMEKRVQSGQDILYLLQDMREFELYGTVKAAVSICDSMNYLEDYEDLVQVLRLANNYLDPKGMFIFDLNTEAKFQAMGSETIAEMRDEGSFIWENEYDEEEKINSYDLTLFIREEDDLYRRYQETHFERAWSLDEIKKALTEAGMEFVAAYDAFTKNAPRKESDRIYVVAREHGKEV